MRRGTRLGLLALAIVGVVAGGAVPLSAAAHPGATFPPRPYWIQLTTNTDPSNRDQVQMAYDPPLHEVVLFGGYDPSVFADGDTWVYHANTWTDLTPNLTVAPAARWGGGFTYDPARHGLLLFGGRSTSAFYSDTWLFNATGWHLLHSKAAPSARNHFAFAYDPAEDGVVLFGGGHGNVPVGSGSAWTFQNDTWSFGPHGWKNLTGSLTGSPGAQFQPAATYDPRDAELVVAGGSVAVGGSLTPSNATWVLYGGGWHLLNVTEPPILYAPEMAWDQPLRCAVEIGVDVATSTDVTWTFSGGAWNNRTPLKTVSPAERGNVGLADDLSDHYLYLFGGDSPGYSYRSDSWAFA